MLTRNADADVSGLDHRDIIGAIADRKRDGLFIPLYKVDHHRFLQRRHSTAHDRLTGAADIQKHPLQRRGKSVVQRGSVDHKCVACNLMV